MTRSNSEMRISNREFGSQFVIRKVWKGIPAHFFSNFEMCIFYNYKCDNGISEENGVITEKAQRE